MIGLTKKEEKLIVSLQQKKFRKAEGLFFVEGIKMVQEAISSSFIVRFVVASIDYTTEKVTVKNCDERTMQRISAFKTAPGILAVVEIPQLQALVNAATTLVLEKVQDPGNFGTIVRTAEALGVKQMICSPDCVDHFSPKVVQSTMGSIFRMNIVVQNLFDFLAELQNTIPIYAAHLNGENIYQMPIETPCVVIVGNESQGISDELAEKVTQRLKIPMVGGAESFNVSIATAIILSEFSRRQMR